MQYAEDQARGRRGRRLFCLSTQAFNYFLQKGGFRLGTPDDLPPRAAASATTRAAAGRRC